MSEKVSHSHLDSKVGTVIVKKGGMSFPSMDNAATNFHAQDGCFKEHLDTLVGKFGVLGV